MKGGLRLLAFTVGSRPRLLWPEISIVDSRGWVSQRRSWVQDGRVCRGQSVGWGGGVEL